MDNFCIEKRQFSHRLKRLTLFKSRLVHILSLFRAEFILKKITILVL